jgi:hypothetical protein
MQNRPVIFESACIFSIIGSSIGAISMLISTVWFKFITEKITSVTNITATEKLSPLYFAILMAAFCVSLTGAIKLYRMQRAGLLFYLTAQIFILFIPVFWLGNQAFSSTNAIFTATFSGIYLYFFKITK